MSTEIKPTQITLNDEGMICYQPQESNPLPGAPIAKLVKGDSLFAPAFEALPGAPLSAEALAAALQAHLQDQLPVFFKLQNVAELPAPVQQLCQTIYNDAGMTPRSAVQQTIAQLDPDMRAVLRNKGVRLGPLFLYCPEMNKPAPLRLRALLWGLYHDMTLPVTRMPDGMVSKLVDTPEAPLAADQAALYKALCYPVYGGRAIRIDMLDRVVNAIYEFADKGQFKAQHAMAEWMGCPIAELYAILESLGHKKIHDPADEAAEKEAAEASEASQDQSAAETAEPQPEQPAAPETSEAPETAAPAPTEVVKPELATFQLKRGKAYQAGNADQGGKSFKNKDKPAFKAHKKPKPKGKKPQKDQGPRVISAGPDKPSLANSPFAVLGQLKK